MEASVAAFAIVVCAIGAPGVTVTEAAFTERWSTAVAPLVGPAAGWQGAAGSLKVVAAATAVDVDGSVSCRAIETAGIAAAEACRDS